MLDNVAINQLRAFVAVCDHGSFFGVSIRRWRFHERLERACSCNRFVVGTGYIANKIQNLGALLGMESVRIC